MYLFKKKKLYKITWTYNVPHTSPFIELVSAYDPAHAWKLVRQSHSTSISLEAWEEVEC